MPATFHLLLLVQFISTLADNALLIVAIARTIELGLPAWLIPVLKISFTVFYVVLAPMVGPVADRFRKGWVMSGANLLKTVAVLWLLSGVNPAWALTLAGLGAALYAPAKYGLITELLPSQALVRANGYFESCTVSAVILGTALGGLLISPWMQAAASAADGAPDLWGPSQFGAGILCLLLLNALATGLSTRIADTGARYPKASIGPLALIRRFARENRLLWQDPLGGLSMAVTTLLWGVGACLQLIVLRWATESLGLSLSQAAYLQGVTALGVIAGAIAAGRLVRLEQAVRLLSVGLLMGALLPALLWVHSLQVAVLLLIVEGALAGFFLVPMNALLQHRGCTLLTAGRSIAVQGFNENAGMLVMLGLYTLATAGNVALAPLVWGLAAAMVLTLAGVWAGRRTLPPARPVPEHTHTGRLS